MNPKDIALITLGGAAIVFGIAGFTRKPPVPDGHYAVAASTEAGSVWRMNTQTGGLELCYVRAGGITCTAQVSPP